MEASMVRDVLVQWGPTLVLSVAAISVAMVFVSFGVLLITNLLGEKKQDDGAHDGHAHGHSRGHASH